MCGLHENGNRLRFAFMKHRGSPFLLQRRRSNRYSLAAAGIAFITFVAMLPFALKTAAVRIDEREGWARPCIVVRPSPDASRVAGLPPGKIRTAYGFDLVSNQGEGTTIAVIEAFDNPDAKSDLAIFSSQFGLPMPDFEVIYAGGTKPRVNQDWASESSMDIEWAHAIAPGARILLVEAPTSTNPGLMDAVDLAARSATVVSMSFGGPEFSGEISLDSHFAVPRVIFCAASGNRGRGAQYPAASPMVVAVGGTALQVDSQGRYINESAWKGSGGGLSSFEHEPFYQLRVQSSGKRGIPDVAYNAAPETGVPVYSHYGFGGWKVVGGTSIGAPQWAGLFAIANSVRREKKKSSLNRAQVTMYSHMSSFHDITSGRNGSFGNRCKAKAGYDFVTGMRLRTGPP